MTENPTPPKSFAERMRDAALERDREQAADRRRVADLVLGTDRATRDRVGELIRVGDDHVVEVITRLAGATYTSTWTTVVGNKRGLEHFRTQDEALLALIARRHGASPSSAGQPAYYAARVLGIPEVPSET